MRTTTILAAGLTLAFAAAANAQTAPSPAQPPATPAPAQPPTAAPEAPSAEAPAIQSVNIVDMAELPEATQTKVNEVVAERGEEGLQKLRTSIEATPQIKTALEAKGLTPANVIAASMGSGGALTLITKKSS
jgi:hypothetical protein